MWYFSVVLSCDTSMWYFHLVLPCDFHLDSMLGRCWNPVEPGALCLDLKITRIPKFCCFFELFFGLQMRYLAIHFGRFSGSQKQKPAPITAVVRPPPLPLTTGSNPMERREGFRLSGRKKKISRELLNNNRSKNRELRGNRRFLWFSTPLLE